uniref:JHAMT n=1 Tax=Eotetranychus kankitus TaxID=2137873 RepID=A0A5P9NYH3_9ACAR|nr:JHAMT [Eotetranychus kankitus]
MNNTPELYDKSNKLQKKDSEYIIRKLQIDYENRIPELIVDLGCGTGNITERLWCSFPDTRIVGVDCSKKMIDYALDHYSTHNLEFFVADICSDWKILSENTEVEKGSVDAVFSTYCLHWISDPDMEKVMKNIYEMMKPGGRCYFAVFSWSWLLPFQEQIIYQKPWDSYFQQLDLTTGQKDELKIKSQIVDKGTKLSSASSSHRSSVSEMFESKEEKLVSLESSRPYESLMTLSTITESPASLVKVPTRKTSMTTLSDEKVEVPKLVRRKSSAPFPVYDVPPEKVRIEKWNKFCEKAGLKPIETEIHDTTFTYQDIEGFKGELQSLCHYLPYLPKDLHPIFLADYYAHMDRCFISRQDTLPKIKVQYQFLTVIAEKPLTSP